MNFTLVLGSSSAPPTHCYDPIRLALVLLIGGNSATGKTTIARELGQQLGIAWAQVDDFRLTMQRVTTPEEQPALHFFEATDKVWRGPAERLAAGLIGVAEVVSEALRVVVAHHVLTPHPLILEGDGLAPAMAADHICVDPETRGNVRAVFLLEDEEGVLLREMVARGRGFEKYSPAERQVQVRASRLYAEWLRAETDRLRLPSLPARPRATVIDRIQAALSNIPHDHPDRIAAHRSTTHRSIDLERRDTLSQANLLGEPRKIAEAPDGREPQPEKRE